MTNNQTQELFEKNLIPSRLFSDWVIAGHCSKKTFEKFIIWLNQLDEDSICKYLKKDASILSVITNQTKKMCNLAIMNMPGSIRYVKNQSKELCELAVKSNGFTIGYIKEQKVDLCLLSLEENINSFQLVRIVPNPNYETTLKNLLEKKAILEAIK